MIECSVKILTPLPIDGREFGRHLFAILQKHFPAHVPQRYGRVEPARKRFNAADLETVLESWGGEFFFEVSINRHRGIVHAKCLRQRIDNRPTRRLCDGAYSDPP